MIGECRVHGEWEREVKAGLFNAVGLETVQTSVTHLLITPPAKFTGLDVRALRAMLGEGANDPPLTWKGFRASAVHRCGQGST